MNRVKLVVLLIFSSVIGILFVQNKQLLTLQLFCPEPTNGACFLLSPELSLAAWMSLFAIAGILSSLCGYLLNRSMSTNTVVNKNVGRKTEDRTYSQPELQRDKPKKSNFSIPKKTPEKSNPKNSAAMDWEEKSSENWEENKPAAGVTQSSKEKASASTQATKKESGSQSKSQAKPTNSDSVYSYKFAESAKNKPKEKESANKKTDDIYDASYRTINKPSPKTTTSNEDDDEEWI